MLVGFIDTRSSQILAIANSIQDLAADVTIARRGYPSMAVAGAYAGPIFNILLGLGIPLSIGIARHGHVVSQTCR